MLAGAVLRGHPPAVLGARAARLRAESAMLRRTRVFSALRCARVACLGTEATEFGREWAATAHHPDGRRARVRAIAVEPDAREHHGDVFFAETGVGARLAGHAAYDTRFDAVVILRTVTAKVRPQFDAGHRSTPQKG